MRENRPYGSEGGEEHSFPTPIHPTANAFLRSKLLVQYDNPAPI